MQSANMLEFFMEDVALQAEFQPCASRFAVLPDDGYSVCAACGIEIVFEHNHPGFTHCPSCGSALVK